jgi:hypothetical protein
MPNLSLNNLQSELIQTAVNNVPPSARLRFLSTVADYLEGERYISDDQVRHAIQNARLLLLDEQSRYDDCA